MSKLAALLRETRMQFNDLKFFKKDMAIPVTHCISETFRTNQITINTTPTLIVGQDKNRNSITIENITGADMYIGRQNVSITSGFLIRQGAAFTTDKTMDEIYGIVGAGTTACCYWEE
jgi:hypothetical protein